MGKMREISTKMALERKDGFGGFEIFLLPFNQCFDYSLLLNAISSLKPLEIYLCRQGHQSKVGDNFSLKRGIDRLDPKKHCS